MKKFNVVICGTNFGKIYLRALLRENSRFSLAGILAKGSKRSEKIAKELSVPLYRSVDELPDSVDIACVIVKSTLLGGTGTKLSMDLLKRKINVIQEHPVHFSEISQCIKTAEENGVVYHLNTHYIHVDPIKKFIDFVRKTVENKKPRFIDVTTSLTYSSIDIIGHALGCLKPFAFTDPVKWESSHCEAMGSEIYPYKCIQGVIGGVPVTIKLQNFFDPDDLDQNYMIMHRISIGSERGNTTLLSSHGPVIWTGGFPVEDKKSGFSELEEKDLSSFNDHIEKYENYNYPSWLSFEKEMKGKGYGNIIAEKWPDAVISALDLLVDEVESKKKPEFQRPEYLNDISDIWVETMKKFGKPFFTKIDKAERESPEPVNFLKGILNE